MTQEIIDKLKKNFEDELQGYEMYCTMANSVNEAHEKQMLHDMANDELCHAKHICMLVGDEEMKEKLHEAMGKHM